MRGHVLLNSVLAYYFFSDTNKTSLNPQGHLKETREIVAKYCPYGGITEKLYSCLYQTFDLKGYYDNDSNISKEEANSFYQFLDLSKNIFGDDIVNMYNWNWISRMDRGIS